VRGSCYEADGAIVYRQACVFGCEGIVSKRLGSRYVPGRAPCWVKVKTRRRKRCAGSKGEYDLTIGDRPAQRMKAGDSGQIPAGVTHSARTHTGMLVLTVLILEKGKPMNTAAP
jgi:hypothetical protein